MSEAPSVAKNILDFLIKGQELLNISAKESQQLLLYFFWEKDLKLETQIVAYLRKALNELPPDLEKNQSSNHHPKQSEARSTRTSNLQQPPASKKRTKNILILGIKRLVIVLLMICATPFLLLLALLYLRSWLRPFAWTALISAVIIHFGVLPFFPMNSTAHIAIIVSGIIGLLLFTLVCHALLIQYTKTETPILETEATNRNTILETRIKRAVILGYLPTFEPRNDEEFDIPIYNPRTQQFISKSYIVKNIQLTPEWMGDPLFAVGLVPKNEQPMGNAFLLFKGTDLKRTNQGSHWTLATAFTPFFGDGELLTWLGRKNIEDFIKSNKKEGYPVILSGMSLGGAMALQVNELFQNDTIVQATVPPLPEFGSIQSSSHKDSFIINRNNDAVQSVGLFHYTNIDIYETSRGTQQNSHAAHICANIFHQRYSIIKKQTHAYHQSFIMNNLIFGLKHMASLIIAPIMLVYFILKAVFIEAQYRNIHWGMTILLTLVPIILYSEHICQWLHIHNQVSFLIIASCLVVTASILCLRFVPAPKPCPLTKTSKTSSTQPVKFKPNTDEKSLQQTKNQQDNIHEYPYKATDKKTVSRY